MGKHSGKKKKQSGSQSSESNSPRNHDDDAKVFISVAQESKDEGNKLFQKRDYGAAMLKYEKAIKLLPKDHVEVAHLRTNIAACYMQMGLCEFPNAIHECDLALKVAPNYSKALLKRARCYEGLNRLDLALKDIRSVLKMEPNNLMATEVWERVKATLENKGLMVKDTVIELPPEYVEPPSASPALVTVRPRRRSKGVNEVETKKDKGKTVGRKRNDKVEEKLVDDKTEEKNIEVVEEKISVGAARAPKRMVKLAFGEDIRWGQVPRNCSLLKLRELIHERFPSSSSVLVKYRDQEGDLVTITSDEELRLAEESMETQGSIRFYIVEASPQQDPFYERLLNADIIKKGGERRRASNYIDDWIVEFGRLFKNHTGLDTDSYMDPYELGMKGYSEALEETITREEAQDLFEKSAANFQEMTALALFNWGNVHMSRARKKVDLNPAGSILERIQKAYDWAMKEYDTAGDKYEEAGRIKPDFYEAVLALGQQKFEKARLSWYYAIGNHAERGTGLYLEETLQLYDIAEVNIEKGLRMWEKSFNLSKLKQAESKPQKRGLDNLFRDTSSEEAAQQASVVVSQINLLWGMILYERSNMEYKFGLPVWRDHLEVAVKKFGLAGASSTEISVLTKYHFSDNCAQEGVNFRIDEIVQAWNEMSEAKRCKSGIPSFRLVPILRRRASKLHEALDA